MYFFGHQCQWTWFDKLLVLPSEHIPNVTLLIVWRETLSVVEQTAEIVSCSCAYCMFKWFYIVCLELGTIYPGLMVTSAVLYHIAWLVNVTIDIRNVCVFLAPFFSSLTTIITYLLTKELRVRKKFYWFNSQHLISCHVSDSLYGFKYNNRSVDNDCTNCTHGCPLCMSVFQFINMDVTFTWKLQYLVK